MRVDAIKIVRCMTNKVSALDAWYIRQFERPWVRKSAERLLWVLETGLWIIARPFEWLVGSFLVGWSEKQKKKEK
ncbi:hypothetical protein [Acidithiobacillus albertensis]|uniref:hypothetical protein n=1 Tax=Acidithiobacillus albertensis TaxID=119978 RepID=UPI00094B6D30|nr:hypothetical protein [Acidithiobacillus albertensis]